MFSQALGSSGLRFLPLEHGVLSLLALLLAHSGRSRARRAVTAAARYRISFVFYALSFILVALIFLLPRMMG